MIWRSTTSGHQCHFVVEPFHLVPNNIVQLEYRSFTSPSKSSVQPSTGSWLTSDYQADLCPTLCRSLPRCESLPSHLLSIFGRLRYVLIVGTDRLELACVDTIRKLGLQYVLRIVSAHCTSPFFTYIVFVLATSSSCLYGSQVRFCQLSVIYCCYNGP